MTPPAVILGTLVITAIGVDDAHPSRHPGDGGLFPSPTVFTAEAEGPLPVILAEGGDPELRFRFAKAQLWIPEQARE